jgi:hypothetical protein
MGWIETGDTYSETGAAAQHDCLPGLLGDGDTLIETVSGEDKKYFILGL